MHILLSSKMSGIHKYAITNGKHILYLNSINKVYRYGISVIITDMRWKYIVYLS